MELEELKYSELQRLAKQHGLKAKLKADKLLKNLQEYFKQEQKNDAVLKEPLPHLEKCKNTDRSDSKRRQRKRRAESEHVTETGAESAGSVADGSATVPQCTPCSPERAASTFKGTAAQSKTGKIPRLVHSVGKSGLNHVTPDWKKIHQANFNKMESIDLYVERKRKRIGTIGNSIKQSVKNTLPLFSPVHQTSKIDRFSTPTNQHKSPRCSAAAVTVTDKSVLPPVCSVTKMNVRFTDTTKGNVKRGAMKTPTRKSGYTLPPSNPGTEVTKGPEKPKGQKQTNINTRSSDQTKVVTPYRFSGITTPGTNKKFDLKASLSRPLSYKPHRGKLKNWDEMKENQKAHSHKKDPKQPKLQTRENRREMFLEERKEKKNNMISARRGLIMS
ncbi:nucleolar and spindle-associated protein 1 isoform X2 [Scyliorhinus canicula]|uniref:nucleolar and spindle-associated protein 1 isoform X2 n=1 Tax=Scyliorhinus canicula TaxID=7830 RepID=UPI0018F71637|nr:nucleolar and spindle-associated protein 1 isoform X2 [Scyliorhinus canicula]